MPQSPILTVYATTITRVINHDGPRRTGAEDQPTLAARILRRFFTFGTIGVDEEWVWLILTN